MILEHALLTERLTSRLALNPITGCLEYTGSRSGNTARNSYGRIKFRGRTYGTHRVAYATAHGPIPDGLLVMHTCDNPPYAENTADMFRKMRGREARADIHCPRGARRCGACRRLWPSYGKKYDAAQLAGAA